MKAAVPQRPPPHPAALQGNAAATQDGRPARLAAPASHDASRTPDDAEPGSDSRDKAVAAARAVEALALAADVIALANREAVHALVCRLRDGLRDGFAAAAAKAATSIAADVAEHQCVRGPGVAPAMLDFAADARDARLRITRSATWLADVYVATPAGGPRAGVGGAGERVTVFADSDFAAAYESRRSTTGIVVGYNGVQVVWSTKLQSCSSVSYDLV